jgi:hypothetical protein
VPEESVAVFDVREYCRRVEDYLTRANGGHLIRIVGPGFELVREWAVEGVPLGIVTRGIDVRVERHRASQAMRPLRIEFCAGDVRQLFEHWRRAVGLTTHTATAGVEGVDDAPEPAAESRRPSLAKHLDRAIARLAATAGQLDAPEALREGAAAFIDELTALRDRAKPLRGAAREEAQAELPAIDRRLAELAQRAATPDVAREVRREAEQDLSAYRGRLTGDRWHAAIAAMIDQRLRSRFGLPTLEW